MKKITGDKVRGGAPGISRPNLPNSPPESSIPSSVVLYIDRLSEAVAAARKGGLYRRGAKDDQRMKWKREVTLYFLGVLRNIEAERDRVERENSKFYSLNPWRELRYRVLKNGDGRCSLCGVSAKDGAILHVDHIKPRSLFPELALDERNLQVLCSECNIGKSNKDETDWRAVKVASAIDSIPD